MRPLVNFQKYEEASIILQQSKIETFNNKTIINFQSHNIEIDEIKQSNISYYFITYDTTDNDVYILNGYIVSLFLNHNNRHDLYILIFYHKNTNMMECYYQNILNMNHLSFTGEHDIIFKSEEYSYMVNNWSKDTVINHNIIHHFLINN